MVLKSLTKEERDYAAQLVAQYKDKPEAEVRMLCQQLGRALEAEEYWRETAEKQWNSNTSSD